MLLSALTLAAALQATPIAGPPPRHRAMPVKMAPRRQSPAAMMSDDIKAFNLRVDRIAKCRGYGVVSDGVTPGAPSLVKPPAAFGMLKRLGDLPPGHGERAVLRTVDGCAVATPIVQRTPAP